MSNQHVYGGGPMREPDADNRVVLGNTDEMSKEDLSELLSAIRCSWSAATSPQWLPTNPAHGQGSATALVFCDRFGGEIMKTPIDHGWHFYNRVAGRTCDFTAEQFSVLPAYLNILSSREEALAHSGPERYQLLAARVGAELGSKQRVLGVAATSVLDELPEFAAEPRCETSAQTLWLFDVNLRAT